MGAKSKNKYDRFCMDDVLDDVKKRKKKEKLAKAINKDKK